MGFSDSLQISFISVSTVLGDTCQYQQNPSLDWLHVLSLVQQHLQQRTSSNLRQSRISTTNTILQTNSDLLNISIPHPHPWFSKPIFFTSCSKHHKRNIKLRQQRLR
jgi:hypothetical protein